MVFANRLTVTNSNLYNVGGAFFVLLFAIGLASAAFGWTPTIFIAPEDYLASIAPPISSEALENGLETARHQKLFLIQSFLFQYLAIELISLFVLSGLAPNLVLQSKSFAFQTKVFAATTAFFLFVIALTPFYVCEGLEFRCSFSYRAYLAMLGAGALSSVLMPSFILLAIGLHSHDRQANTKSKGE